MKKSISLGEECIELLNQQSSSTQMITQVQNGLSVGQQLASAQFQNPSTNSQHKLTSSNSKTNMNLLQENESSLKDIISQQPQYQQSSHLPSNSHSMLSSQRNSEILFSDTNQQIGVREGAMMRSRLFLESKDCLPPKSGISNGDDEEILTGEETFQLKLAPQKIASQTEKKDPPSLLAVYDKPRISQISSQSLQSAAAFKQHLIKEAYASNSNNMQMPTQQPSTHTVGGGSNLANSNNPYSVLMNTNSQNRKSIGAHFPSDLNNKHLLGSKIEEKFGETSQLSESKVPAAKTFINVNRFGYLIKKQLAFMRPSNLSALQRACINDKACNSENKQLTLNQQLSKKEVANATRDWIYAPRKLRKLKQILKPVYIVYLICKINLVNFFENQKCFAVESYINLFRETLKALVKLVMFVVIPLNCAFDIPVTEDIKDISAIICFVDILLTFFVERISETKKHSKINEIAINYVSSTFLFDLITAISLLSMQNPLISLLFYLRFFYDISITSYSKQLFAIHFSCVFEAIYLLFPFLVIVFHFHIFACSWAFFVLKQGYLWTNQFQFETFSIFEQYMKSFYYAGLTLTNSNNQLYVSEILFHVFLSIYSCCLLAYVFSAVHSYSKMFSKPSSPSYLNAQMKMSKYLKSSNIPLDIRLLAQKQVEHSHLYSEPSSKNQIKPIQEMVTAQLQAKIQEKQFLEHWSRNRIINEYFSNPVLASKLSRKVEERTIKPGQYILCANNLTIPCLYFIASGSVEILVPRGSSEEEFSVLETLHKGSSFGELEFFSQSFMTSLSVRAKTFTRIMSIALSDFHDEIQSFPDEKEALCYLKDCIIFNNDHEPIGLTCLSCHSSKHSIIKCPFLSFQKSMEKTFQNLDSAINKQIAAFKRSLKRKKISTLSIQSKTQVEVQGFTTNHDELMNSSLYEEYLDEVSSEKQSFFKQQTAPNPNDEKSSYSRKTSKKPSLKQAQTVDDLSFQRKGSMKNQSQKLLNPNSLEEIHEKSSISKISQFSNRAPIRMEIEEKKQSFALSSGAGNPQSSDSDLGGANSRKRTHSGLSQFIGSRKSPLPSEKDWNHQYSGSLVSSLRLSEADRRILNLEDRNVHEGNSKIGGTPNLFVIRINEGEEQQLSSGGRHKGQYYGSGSSGVYPTNSIEAVEQQARRNSSSFSIFSRNQLNQSSYYPAHEEFSELRLDQQTQTIRARDNSFQLHANEINLVPAFSLENSPRNQVLFEEQQQNFKVYFAHNNLQNLLNKPMSDIKGYKNVIKPSPKSHKQKQSKFLKVVSVNKKQQPQNNIISIKSPTRNKNSINNTNILINNNNNNSNNHTPVVGQNDHISALLPYKKNQQQNGNEPSK